ncbi:MAG TPA: HAD-IIB family hydrolase [Geobacterales bacterium]|nr:HAD-IIB family hydrolase [Geobacterales bacterium]
MNYKLLFLDIDGTITDERGLIANESLEAIRQLKKNDYIIIACSASAYFSVRTLNRYFQLFDHIIAENGGVLDLEGDPVILSDKSYSQKALEMIKRNFTVKEHWSNPIRLSDQALVRPAQDEVVNSIKEFVKNMGLNVKVLDTGFSLVITKKEVSKVTAARLLVEKLSLKNIETYTIGDSEVDIEIFDFAHKPFALRNSHPELKKKAVFIASEAYYKGFLEVVKKLIEN